MAINTLYDYYTSKGQTLPTWNQRYSDPSFASAAKAAGISQGAYTGLPEQNTAILSKLIAGSTPSVLPSATTPQTQLADLQAQQAALQSSGLTNTNQLTKTSTGSYVPSTTSSSSSYDTYDQQQQQRQQEGTMPGKYRVWYNQDTKGLDYANPLPYSPAEAFYDTYEEALRASSNLPAGTTGVLGIYDTGVDPRYDKNAKPITAPTGTTGTTGNTGTGNITLQQLQAMLSGGNDYQKQIQDLINQMNTQYTNYQSALTNRPTPDQMFQTYSEKLGIPGMQADVTAKTQAVKQTEDMLNALEDNINQRISGSGMLEAQRQRQYAVEQKPLAKTLGSQVSSLEQAQIPLTSAQGNLSQMLNLAGQGQEQQLAALKAPLDYSSQVMNTLQNMARYQSPQQELAQNLMQQLMEQQMGLGATASTNTPSSYDEWSLAGGQAGTGMDYASWLNRKTSSEKSGLTLNQKIDAEMSLYSKVQAANKLQTEVVRNVNGVNALWEDFNKGSITSLNAISQAIITSFGKILDPGSVVRESEYARTPEGLSLVSRAQGFLDKMAQGGAGLTKDNLREFINAINVLGTNAQTEINRTIETAKSYGSQYGLNTSLLGGINQINPPNVETDLVDTINSYLDDYKKTFGREQLIKDLVPVFPELTEKQIGDKVYEITNQIGWPY